MADDYRVFNFSAGPSILPEPVLRKCADEMLNYEGTGESVMEMSHRSPEFQKIIDDAEANLRKLMNIPDDYYVMFLQGGGTLQFSMVPINLMTGTGKADYIVAGQWGKKAWEEARKFGDARCVASSEADKYAYIPKVSKEDIRDDVDYVYICYNNTVFGTHYNELPDFGDHLLVADMSSCILSEEIDVTKFGLIYAGAQKNVAPAGVTIVIVRKDLVGKAPANTPIIVEGTAGEHPCTIIESAEGPTVNCLSVSDGTVTGNGFIYALANKDQGVGFYPVGNGITIPAGKAYLDTSSAKHHVKGFLALGGVADAINNIAVETANGTIFNIAGQKVQNITKGGLYIVNGKKVFVK